MRGSLITFAQLQVAMALGAGVCLGVGSLARTSALSGVYWPGSLLYFLGDIAFLAGPSVGWIAARRGRRDGSVLGALMTLPVAGVAVAGVVAGGDALRWLVNGMYPVMSVGALAYALVLARPPSLVRPAVPAPVLR